MIQIGQQPQQFWSPLHSILKLYDTSGCWCLCQHRLMFKVLVFGTFWPTNPADSLFSTEPKTVHLQLFLVTLHRSFRRACRDLGCTSLDDLPARFISVEKTENISMSNTLRSVWSPLHCLQGAFPCLELCGLALFCRLAAALPTNFQSWVRLQCRSKFNVSGLEVWGDLPWSISPFQALDKSVAMRFSMGQHIVRECGKLSHLQKNREFDIFCLVWAQYHTLFWKCTGLQHCRHFVRTKSPGNAIKSPE